MDQKIKTIWALALVLTPLVLPLAAIMLIIFSVTVCVVIPIKPPGRINLSPRDV